MKKVRLNLKKRSYDINIGKGVISKLHSYIARLNIGDTAYVITNATIKNRYGAKLINALKKASIDISFKVVPDTEKSKSIEISTQIITDIAALDKKKRIFIIAFGGGVIGDLSGFVASIYKRGIPYIQIPTTLLAQVDSGIGGKTAVDLIEGKNLVGAFYQPRLVLSDTGFLASLDKRQIRSGLAEVIKYGAIKDRELFIFLEKKHKDILRLEPKSIEHVVYRCSLLKAAVVQKDEREEKEVRTILNFGHTIGHAIEAASKYSRYTHGEAVALGMLVASDISLGLGLIKETEALRLSRLIKAFGLPSKIRNLSTESIIEAHYRDKKFIGKSNRFVLLENIGKVKVVKNVALKIIRQAINKRK